MTLRTRVSLWMGVTLCVVITAMGTALYLSEKKLLTRNLEETRQSLVHNFAQTCADAWSVHDELAAVNAAETLRRTPGVLDAYCVNTHLLVFAHSNGALIGKKVDALPPPAPHTWTLKENWPTRADMLRRSTNVGRGQSHAGVVFSRSHFDALIEKTLRDTARRISGITAGALLVGLLGALILASGLTRPIRAIAQGTRELAQGHLDHRLNIQRSDELGQLATDFNQMAVRLGELDQMKNDFVANVSHELRSPLSAIEGYINFITEEIRRGRPEKILDYLATMRNNATRLGKFVNNVLDLSKIDAGQIAPDLKAVDVTELLEELVDLYGPKAREISVTLTAENVPANVTALADPDHVRQALTNLVGNALKFTPPGGSVTLSAQGGVIVDQKLRRHLTSEKAATRYVRISVADTGPGISPTDLPRLFNRFEQVKEAREKVKGNKGTGLGLAITRELMEAQGGAVMVDSALNQGSVFSLYLPQTAATHLSR
ncbi:MAG: HAMP domain-containing histidine kinase [Elusimicrobia bacterium]|nr:HAMP domain-containing histidine kinase [Elusimicrobiota bacterium]